MKQDKMKTNYLNDINFVIFDLDGVFYKDYEPIQGGKEMIGFLKKHDIGYCFLTNNSSFPLYIYKEKLQKCGILANKDKIITTTILLESYILESGFKDIYVLGSPHLKKYLYERFPISKIKPDALILGMHDEITLKELANALNLLSKDTKIVAANPDKLIPKSDGFGLECGVMIDLFEDITDKKVFTVGKPNNYAYDFILKKFKAKRENTLMVGDTYETDITGAINSGIKAVWVDTGNKLPKTADKENFLKVDSLHALTKSIQC